MIRKSVFLDTSFLVASQVFSHEFMERTIELRKKFIQEDYKIFIHPLTLDEFWYVLIGLGKKAASTTPPEKLFKQIKEATKNIFSFESLNLLDVNLTEKDLMDTLELMYKFKLRPRDAMIVKLMKKAGIKDIASFDTDFDQVNGVFRIY